MGHIVKRKRKNGYAYQARVPDPVRGGTAKIEKTFRTKRDAEAWVAKMESSRHDGSWTDPRLAERPFREVVEAWKESWVGRLELRTVASHTANLERYIMPVFGLRAAGSITHAEVQRWTTQLTSAHELSGQTVRGIYSTMRAAMNYGLRLGLVRHNPCQRVQLPRPRRRDMVILEPVEIRSLADAIDPRYRALIYLAGYTGLRAGEIAGLTLDDLDLDRRRLHIRRAVKEVGGHQYVGDTKTHQTRSIALPRFLCAMLREHVAEHVAPIGTSGATPLFPSPEGAYLRHRNFLQRFFRKAVARALPPERRHMRFHDLRHTAVALLISQNAPPKAIQARLGHCSIQMTMDRYGHLLPSVEDALTDDLDALFEREQVTPDATT